MHDAEAHKLRVFQPGNHRKDALLLAPFEIGLKADKVPHRSLTVFAPQLHHGIGALSGVRVGQSHRLHHAVADGVLAALGKHLHRHAALIDAERILLEFVQLGGFRMNQCIIERKIFLALHRAVEIILTAAFAVARCVKRTLHRNAFAGHDRCRGIVKIERFACQCSDRTVQRFRGQRPRGDDDASLRDLGNLFRKHRDLRMRTDLFRHQRSKRMAIHSECTACFHGSFFGAGHQQRPEPAHFLLEQTCRGVDARCLERIGADQLGKLRRMMRRRHFLRLHLMQQHRNACLRKCPCRFAARKPAADHMHGFAHIGLSKPQSGFSHTSLPERPPFLKSVLPHLGQRSSTGVLHVMKLHSG